MSNEDIVDVSSRETSLRAAKMDGLKTWGWISYALHLVVAVAAVVPSMQASVALLLVALLIDFVKRDDAKRYLAGKSFFLAHQQRDLGRCAVPGHGAAVAVVPGAWLDCLDHHLAVVPVPHRARHGGHVQ